MNKSNNDQPLDVGKDVIGNWENEGGSPYRENYSSQYGKRIEHDQTWTVYHVFTGVPADAGNGAMIGLGKAEAAAAVALFADGKEARGNVSTRKFLKPVPSASPWDFRRWL